MNRRVLAVSAARFVDSMGGGMAYFTLPILIANMGINGLPVDFVSGAVISVWGLFATLSQPAAGVTLSKVGKPRIFLITSLLATSVLIYLYPFASGILGLVALRAGLGIVESFLMVSSLVLVVHFSGKKKGEAFGIYNTLTDLGFSISPVLAGLLVATGLGVVFTSASLLVLMSAIVIYLIVEDVEGVHSRWEEGGSFRAFRGLKREIYAVSLSLASVMAVLSSIVPLENSFLERLSVTPFEFGVAFSAYLFTRTLFNTPAGIISDRIGSSRIFVLSIMAFSATAVLLTLPDFSFFFALRLLQGVVAALIFTSSASFIAERCEKSAAIAMSVMSASITAGLTAGPLISGFLSGFYGFEVPFILLAILTLIPLLLLR